jgi:hypothetical protein
VDEDYSGLTFRNGTTDSSHAPVSMVVYSSELCATDFDLKEVIPLQLETMTCGDRLTRGAALKKVHDTGTMRYVLSVDYDNEFRS